MYNSHNYFQIARLMRMLVLVLMILLVFATIAFAGPSKQTTEREVIEGSNPHSELKLRDKNLFDLDATALRDPVNNAGKKSA